MAALKKIQAYVMPVSTHRSNAIYEPELVELLRKKAVEQIVITVVTGGYWVAVLANQRMEMPRPGEAGEQKVVRLRHVRAETEGFAPLYAVRTKSLRIYRSLDTLVKSITRFGSLPLTIVQQGVLK